MGKYDVAIFEYCMERESTGFPYQYEISRDLNILDATVKKSLKKMFQYYPTHLFVNSTDKKILDVATAGKSIPNIAKELELSPERVHCSINKMLKDGVGINFFKTSEKIANVDFLTKIKRNEKRIPEEPVVSVKIIKGDHTGKFGYMDKDTMIVLHINGAPQKFNMYPYEYEVLERKIKKKIESEV